MQKHLNKNVKRKIKTEEQNDMREEEEKDMVGFLLLLKNRI